MTPAPAYRVSLDPSAIRDLSKLPREAQAKVQSKIDALAHDPRLGDRSS